MNHPDKNHPDHLERTGKLWGVGVGPGDPELLTLKAVRVLRQADVVMLPDANSPERKAMNIINAYLEGKTLAFANMPMVRDKATLEQAHAQAADRICELLDQGKNVVFPTLGDPTIYSTYMYLHQRVLDRGYPAEVVPGVPSFCAAAARLDRSLCQGREALLIIPASHRAETLPEVSANKVFMKAGRSILELQQALRESGQLEGAAMVENCCMENEKFYPHFAELKEPSGYFSLVIVKQKSEDC